MYNTERMNTFFIPVLILTILFHQGCVRLWGGVSHTRFSAPSSRPASVHSNFNSLWNAAYETLSHYGSIKEADKEKGNILVAIDNTLFTFSIARLSETHNQLTVASHTDYSLSVDFMEKIINDINTTLEAR